jgi:hypothetical protein
LLGGRWELGVLGNQTLRRYSSDLPPDCQTDEGRKTMDMEAVVVID